MSYFLYILYSESHDRYYIGQTQNYNNRIVRHNSGGVKSTKPYRPWVVLYTEKYNTRLEAVQRETYLKSLKSKIKIKELVDASR